MACPTNRPSVEQPADATVDGLLPLLQALADPNRLRIVLILRERERCVCHLTEELGLSQGTVSHHMGVLKKVGLVLDRRDGSDARWVYYRLSPATSLFGARLAELLDPSLADPTPADCCSNFSLDSRTQNPEPRDARGGA